MEGGQRLTRDWGTGVDPQIGIGFNYALETYAIHALDGEAYISLYNFFNINLADTYLI